VKSELAHSKSIWIVHHRNRRYPTPQLSVWKAEFAHRAHREQEEEKRSKMGDLWRDTGLVFTTTRGTPLDVGNLTYKSFRPLLKRAGHPKIRFHALRHTFATLMLSGNVNPKIVQEILGHARMSETIDTYSHYLPDVQDEAIGKLGKLLT
jgi:integrase